jgi:hypothetical protein
MDDVYGTEVVQHDSGLTPATLELAEVEPRPLEMELHETGVLAGVAPAHANGGVAATAPAAAPATTDAPGPLLSSDESKSFRARWDAVQVGFVDEPRQAVEQADALVAAALKRLAEIFAEERARLGGLWGRGDNVSTEELRLALKRYRSFFGRLLSV